MSTDIYQNPLCQRYASKQMQHLFSDDKKFKTWRRLWIALAEAESELGLPVSQQQIDELKAFADDINYDVAKAREREVRHDVMAHIYAYGVQCPLAKPIIHLGATSCYVGDNTDIIVMREGLNMLKARLLSCMDALSKFALQYKDMPTLGFTHLQPAQLTTVGKRAALWLQDLMMDYYELESRISAMMLRGVKGTTGTQASFLTLFEGDHEKVKRLEQLVADKLDFKACYDVTGQTYPRKLDYQILSTLSGIAQSASKFSNDMRILASLKELEEPFESGQVGSSAMAYKRNPMRSERITSLSRFVMSLPMNPAVTAATQWFERTLDDSANKRISIAQAFLATDAVLILYQNIVEGLVVYPKVIRKRINDELPFMATETILMEAVRRGGDRQELHESIRTHSMEAGRLVKQEGRENILIELITADPEFKLTKAEIDAMLSPENFTGRAAQQVEEFIADKISPIIDAKRHLLGQDSSVEV
ncbi:MAG: adenylosuccinate lyase [Christensenellales bacterium]|jgi:adenylosuccinate lyase